MILRISAATVSLSRILNHGCLEAVYALGAAKTFCRSAAAIAPLETLFLKAATFGTGSPIRIGQRLIYRPAPIASSAADSTILVVQIEASVRANIARFGLPFSVGVCKVLVVVIPAWILGN